METTQCWRNEPQFSPPSVDIETAPPSQFASVQTQLREVKHDVEFSGIEILRGVKLCPHIISIFIIQVNSSTIGA